MEKWLNNEGVAIPHCLAFVYMVLGLWTIMAKVQTFGNSELASFAVTSMLPVHVNSCHCLALL